MNPLFNTPSGTATKSIAKVFGVLFIVLCLIASVLSIGLPHGSSAAGDEVILKPVADTFINNLKPDQGNGQSSHLDVRGDLRMITFLRFEISGLAQGSITKAHLRLFAIKGSDGRPVSLQLFATPADWDELTVNGQQQPAIGQPIAESVRAPIEQNQWVDLDLGQAVIGDGVYSFALTTDSVSRLSFRSSTRAEAPQLALTLQPVVVPDASADPTITPPSDSVGEPDPQAAIADATEPQPDAELNAAAPGEPAPQMAAPDTSALQAQIASAIPNPMGCKPGEVFSDMQDWWRNPNPTKDHGHLHISVCFPHGQTLTGKVSFRVRSVMHMNPGSLVRVAIYTTAPTVSGAKTCGGNGGLACVPGLPRTQARCAATSGTLAPDGMTCTWWDTLVVNTADVAYDGWQEFRFKGYVKEPDGTEMIVSNGLYAYFKNGHTVKNVTSSWDQMTARGWYTNVGYTNADLISPPTKPVSGIWKPYVKFGAPSGAPITGYYAALDTDFHNNNPGIPIKSGTAAWRGNLAIDTTKLSNGWHRLFLKSDAYMSSSGSTNSGVLAILFEVNNGGSASNNPSSPAAFEASDANAAALICKPDGRSIASAPKQVSTTNQM